MYLAKDKECLGPYIIIASNGRQFSVKTEDNTKRQMFGAFQVKTYFRDLKNLFSFKSYDDLGPPPFSVLITDVIEPNDPRALKLDDSKKKETCLLYTSPSPRDQRGSRMPSSA